jgi:hypothetical protein
MRAEIGVAQLVLDQHVGGFRIRNPQQRLGQAHQHHALLAGELVGVHEGVDAALPHPVLAHLAHQLAGASGDPVLQVCRQLGLRQQGLDHAGFVGAIMGAQAGAQRIGLRERLGEDHDRTLRKDRRDWPGSSGRSIVGFRPVGSRNRCDELFSRVRAAAGHGR